MKKITKLTVAILILISIVNILNLKYNFFEKIFSSKSFSNIITITINNEEKIDKTKINIFQKDNGVVVKNGNNYKDYISLYGWSCFSIEYDSVLICDICYFKKNYHDFIEHNFVFYTKNNKVDVELFSKNEKKFDKIYYKYYCKNKIYIYDAKKNLVNTIQK